MSRSGRIGLSEYTAQRLAELRARRAEAEISDGYGDSSVRDSSSNAALGLSTSTLSSNESASSSNVSVTSSPAKMLVDEETSATKVPTSDAKEMGEKERDFSSGLKVQSAIPVSFSGSLSSAVNDNSQSGRAYASEKSAESSYGGRTGSQSGLRAVGGSLSVNDFGFGSSTVNGDSPASTPSLSHSNSKLMKNDEDCIGFANLPEQVHRKAVKRGFDFTLMVVGESGLGKSTLMSSMFLNQDLYKDRTVPGTKEQLEKTVTLEKRYLEIEERGVKLRLTIVDTPGFNDSLDSSQCWKPIEEYIHQQFDQYFKDESGLNRRNIKDNRVHCCLYFISPYVRGLRQIDVQLMQRLHNKVNIVPVIAKADTLTHSELKSLKTRILDDIDKNKICIYELPQCDSDEDDDYYKKDEELKSSVPFAVIGSNAIVEVNGKKVKGRIYPWGIVEVENPLHSDFTKLRQFLVSTHMQDLKDLTRDIHYENFRATYIQKHQKNPNEQSNLSSDSGDTEADQLLLQREIELQRMQEMLKKMQAELSVAAKTSSNVETSDMTKLL